MFLPDNSFESVDWGNPINGSHPLAKGLRGFWLAVPNRLGWGSLKWRDLCKRYDLGTAAFATSTWMPAPQSRGQGAGSVRFQAALTQTIFIDSAPATALPITIDAGFNVPNTTGAYNLVFVGDKDTNDINQVNLQLRGDVAGDPVRAESRNNAGTTVSADSTTGYSANEWTHGCARFTSTTLRDAFINGGSKGSETSLNTPTTSSFDRFSIGGRHDSTPTGFYEGRVAFVRIWDIALSDSLIAEANKNWREGFPGLLNRVPLRRYSPEQAAAAAGRGKIIGGGVGRASGYILGA